MFSRQIDLAAMHIRESETAKEERRSSNYRDKTRRKPFPKELENSSLTLFKKLLADSKAKSDDAHLISAVSPFTKQTFSQIASQTEGVLKLDPSSQVAELYHKLIDKLVAITKDGIQKTTFTLNSASFGSSVFRGTTVTIVEYSTAPKIFNIQFTADPKAIALLELHAADLQTALNNGGHNFDVGRIDTSLMTEDEQHAIKPIDRDPEEDDNE